MNKLSPEQVEKEINRIRRSIREDQLADEKTRDSLIDLMEQVSETTTTTSTTEKEAHDVIV